MVRGANNCLIIGAGSFLNNVSIHIIGKDNVIEYGVRVRIGKNCSFWIEGNHCKIIVGDNTTFTQKVYFNAQEDNSEIVCGKDRMFSNMIIVRISDSHAILDMKTQKRINPAKNVNIGDHVWIAPNYNEGSYYRFQYNHWFSYIGDEVNSRFSVSSGDAS